MLLFPMSSQLAGEQPGKAGLLASWQHPGSEQAGNHQAAPWPEAWGLKGIKMLSYYRKSSSISRTKSQNINVSCILLQLSPLNPLKPGVEFRMKM